MKQESLARLAEMIRGSPHNLVSRKAREELETRHIPECVAFAHALPDVSPILDVGSGGGLPGLVIAIMYPERTVHLLEATGKKVDFLRSAASKLGLNVEVHHGRAEELGNPEMAGRYPIVTARAVAPLERLVPWCEPFMSSEGELHAIKGDRWDEELAQAAGVLARLGLVVRSTPDGRDPGRSSPGVVRIARK